MTAGAQERMSAPSRSGDIVFKWFTFAMASSVLVLAILVAAQ
ncbi:MAG: hypothetical protein QOD99_818, partial [Chthoniobacter sp.]|nr:hypothetical protein [Chthoniobacter sp.]